MSEDSRTFDELPERVWRSPEAQLAGRIEQFENRNTAILSKISQMQAIKDELAYDIPHGMKGLKVIIDYDKTYNKDRDLLNQAFERNDLSAIKQIIQMSGAKN